MDVVVSNYSWLRKSDLTEDQINFLKSNLTIYPKQYRVDEKEEQAKIELFVETNTSIGIARAYFESKKRSHHNIINDLCDGDVTIFKKQPLIFQGALRPIQIPIVEKVLQEFANGKLGGLISMPTGSGKTATTCYLISKLQKPTLILVHKEFLMDQWTNEIKKFLPAAKVGKVQQDICDYKDKHVVVAMIQTLNSREYTKDFYNYFGMLAADEAHHLAADSFSQVMPKFKARHRLGLSATFRRADQAENVFYYHLGPILAKAELLPLIPKIRKVFTDFHLVKTSKFNPALISDTIVLRFLCANISRNEQIIQQLIQALQAGRKVLVTSCRIKHLKLLKTMFENQWRKQFPRIPIPLNEFCIGGVTEEDIKKAEKGKVIWGSTQYVSEGFNIPSLDTLILTTPQSDVEQLVGRITRICEGKKEPVVVDFRDDMVAICKTRGNNRDELYAKLCGTGNQ